MGDKNGQGASPGSSWRARVAQRLGPAVRLRGRAGQWFGRWPLFAAIAAWIVVALGVFTGLSRLWSGRVWWGWHSAIDSSDAGVLEVVKVVLTTLGGIGAVGYLVIKYRERAAAESSVADTRLLAAVTQLGDPTPQVRIAGVYGLGHVSYVLSHWRMA